MKKAIYLQLSGNVLLMLKSDDFRVTDERFKGDYQKVTDGIHTTEVVQAENGYSCRIFQGTDGNQYEIFADYSVRLIKK